jgi:hypothetical protein
MIKFFARWQARQPELFRAWPLLLVFVLTFPIVCYLAPQKAGLMLHGASKLAFFSYAGYWVDRGVSRFRPEELEGIAHGAAEKRRAWIVCSCILAGVIGTP